MSKKYKKWDSSYEDAIESRLRKKENSWKQRDIFEGDPFAFSEDLDSEMALGLTREPEEVEDVLEQLDDFKWDIFDVRSDNEGLLGLTQGLEEVEESLDQQDGFEWDAFTIAEDFDNVEVPLELNQASEKDCSERELRQHPADIFDEQLESLSIDFLNHVCSNQQEISKQIDDNSSQNSDVTVETSSQVIASTQKKSTASKKAEGLKNDLFSMEKAILAKTILIRHDGGLYYYNGRCYSALRGDLELLELIRKQVSTSAFDVGSTRPFLDLMVFLKSDPSLIPNNYEEKLERAKTLVALDNGVLDISTLTLHKFDSKYLLFHSINASWTGHYPKVFMKFIRQACSYDEEVVRLVLEVMGYLLSGSNLAKAFFVIGTAPDSGKSTLAALIKKLVGESFTCSIEPHKLSERFSLGSSRGRIINLAMDIPRGRLNDAAVSALKAISGSDSISIEQKFQRIEDTTSSLRFLMGTNFPIALRDNDDPAFWNRLVAIPFTHSVPQSERDPDLLVKLWEERDAIVSTCLRYYKTVLENGYQFSPCKASDDLKASWRHEDPSMHTFAMFWSDFVEVTGYESDVVLSQDLYDRYVIYCQDRGDDPVYFTKIKGWIEENTDPLCCKFKRVRQNSANPRAVYCGIKIHY